jgi:hypothetical protein
MRNIQHCPINFFSTRKYDICQLYRRIQLVLDHINYRIVLLRFMHYGSLKSMANQKNMALKFTPAGT